MRSALPPDLPPQTFRLPLGFSVTISWSNGSLGMEWSPSMPTDIRSPRHRRKFLAAYQAARAEYMQIVATVMGGSVMVIDTHDTDGRENPSAQAISPAERH
jgi:hypothetical protein